MAVPIWMTDVDYPAPCPCGRPMLMGSPTLMVNNDDGMKRMYHMECAMAAGMIGPGMTPQHGSEE